MTLTEALASAALRDARLVASPENHTAAIRWVHIADAGDIGTVAWQTGDLLLMHAHQWPASDAAAEALLARLGDRAVAGVVLVMRDTAPGFTPASIVSAKRSSIALIETCDGQTLSAVAETLLQQVFQDRAQTGARSAALPVASLSAALSSHSVPDLARSLSAFLQRDVNVVNQEGILLGASAMTATDIARERQYIQALHQTGGLKSVLDSMVPVVLAAVPALNIAARLGCPVRIGGGLAAIIWVDEGSAPLHAGDFQATEHAAIIAALHITHMRALYEQEERLGYAFVGSLLEGQFEDTQTARSRAAIHGWDARSSYRICLVLLDEPLPLLREGLLRMERFIQRLRDQLRQLGAPALLFASLNQITLLLPEPFAPETLWTALGSKGAAMAVSRLHCSAAGMATGSSDVQSMLDLLRPGRIHYFDEVLFSQALLGDSHARTLFIEKRLRPLRDEKSGALFETLEALCDEGFQLAGASRRLSVHISTLRYRLERIESLLNVVLEDPAIRFELQVAVAMFRLMPE